MGLPLGQAVAVSEALATEMCSGKEAKTPEQIKNIAGKAFTGEIYIEQSLQSLDDNAC